jgi:2-aminoethylphosphonate transport system permease protein
MHSASERRHGMSSVIGLETRPELGEVEEVVSRRRAGGRKRHALWVLPPALLVAGMFGYPLILTVVHSARSNTGTWTLLSWRLVTGSREFHAALWTTVEIAILATVGCLVLGTFFALVCALVPFPGARLVSRLVDVMLAFPSFLIALSFTFLYGAAGVLHATGVPTGGFLYTRWCVILAEITFYTPFVMRPVLTAFSHIPSERLDVAASLGARPGRVFRQVILPEALPALAASGSLTLLLTLNEFGIVLFIGAKDVTTLPMLVESKGVVTFDYPGACVIAVVEVALSLALYAIYRWVLRRTGGDRAAGME